MMVLSMSLTSRIFLVIAFSVRLLAQDAVSIPSGSRLFIAKMEGGLDGFIPPEMHKHKVPFAVVLDDKDADFVLTGVSQKAGSAWYDVLAGGVIAGKDKFEANVQLVSVKEKKLVWSAEAGDRSVLLGAFRRGGQRKIAERIVKQMKAELFNNAKK
jgi:hypothetical protein